MTYRVTGLDPADFAEFGRLDESELAAKHARRVIVDVKPGYPCRVTLQDAEPGEELILLHHVSHDVPTPYRSSYAIFIRPDAAKQAEYSDCVPPIFEGRPLGLRAFDEAGMLRQAALALPGQADAKIREILTDSAICYIDAHNAAHGCFAARVERA